MKYGIGIDISKGKSTVAVVDSEKKIIQNVFEITHEIAELEKLGKVVEKLGVENVKIVLESTGRYHLPVYTFLISKGYFVVAENPYLIKKYLDKGIRKAKTDKKDAIKIARYVIDNWDELRCAKASEEKYEELRFLSREYAGTISLQTKQKVDFANLCDIVFPGYSELLNVDAYVLGLKIFKEFNDIEKIKSMREKEFISSVEEIAKKENKVRAGKTLAQKIYFLAQNVVALTKISSSKKIIINQIVDNLINTINTTDLIITQMEEIARGMEEYKKVREMPGVGKKLSVLLIAEVGDINRFKNAGSLIAYAGIDAPPYQSGKYDAKSNHISKRGNKYLRKTTFEVIAALKKNHKVGTPVYDYVIKKEQEGKVKKVAAIAGINKFLKIYYGTLKAKNQVTVI